MLTVSCLLLLVGSLPQEAVHLNLAREEGPLGEYRFELADSAPESGVKIEAMYTAVYKGDGKVYFEPTKFEMLLAGAENNTQPFLPAEVKTDDHGLPINPDVAGMQLIYVIHQFGGYLPNQKVDLDERFAIEHTHGESSLKGEGRFLGFEDISGKKLARIKITGTYTAVQAMPKLDIELDSWFDPTLHRVTRVRGKLFSVEERKGQTKRHPVEISIEQITKL
ncbi:MAG: hypothetical protein AB7F50_02920 [Fimbriimonadaceae bacterium]